MVIWFIDCLKDISQTVTLIYAILSPLKNLPVYKWGHFLLGEPWLSDYWVLIANLKERLVLSVGIPLLSIETQCEGSPPCYFNLINPASWYLGARKSYAQGWTYVLFKSSRVLLRSFQKNEMFSRSFAFYKKRTKHSLRSLTFFIKERVILCILLCSL